MPPVRSLWKSKLGFILAASGSAIGLGNIVFFPANAYRYGGGAFYLPYFIALFVIGIPVMICEFGLGGLTKKSFPLAMRQAAGTFGEFFGWFAILNAGVIMMYYVTILGWVVGMGLEALREPVAEVFAASSTTRLDWLGPNGGSLANPTGTFFGLASSWTPVAAVLFVWLLNFAIVSRGTRTIEPAVKLFVPLMWLSMLVLVIQGLSLPGGLDGVEYLFTPELEALTAGTDGLQKLDVWQGAMAQMFFTLSLGFGIMTAYASYLPDDSDHRHSAITTSLLNCGFEWLAGVAIFSILFAFSILPRASTLGMMFFITPAGIAELPEFAGQNVAQIFSIAFFCLLLAAGLTSSVSLLEAMVAAMADKFALPRWQTLLLFGGVGCLGSIGFALPQIVDSGLAHNGTLGLTLLDLVDHWAFTYGLLFVGFFECVLLGWGFGSERIREFVNRHSRVKLGRGFDLLIRFVIPGLIAAVIVYNLATGELAKGLYGADRADSYTDRTGILGAVLPHVHLLAFGAWAVGCVGGSWFLATRRGAADGGVA